MSGLDPLAALAAQLVANAQAAIAEAALDLGAATHALQAQLTVGDIITATVLPAENGSDRLQIFGQTIAARLPPGVNPGEQLALQVTGFTNAAILVRNLGAVDPQNPPPQPAIELPASAPDAPQRAVLRSVPTGEATPPEAPPSSPEPPTAAATTPSAPPLAPPRELFVAASVVPNPSAAAPPEADEAPPAPPDALEARIALTRTASAPPPTNPSAARPAQATPAPAAPAS
ncbi:MAG: hypothetical protein KGN02_14865, partial [bacterium]|nr:hypothetical protein [bacterium]